MITAANESHIAGLWRFRSTGGHLYFKSVNYSSSRVSDSHFLPLRLAAKRARGFAVSALLAPCGALGAPNAGGGVDNANGLPAMPFDPEAKLKPPLGAGGAGVARGPEIRRRECVKIAN